MLVIFLNLFENSPIRFFNSVDLFHILNSFPKIIQFLIHICISFDE